MSRSSDNEGQKGQGVGGMYSSRTGELWGQLSPGDNSYCCNKVALVLSRGGNSSPKAVLVTSYAHIQSKTKISGQVVGVGIDEN